VVEMKKLLILLFALAVTLFSSCESASPETECYTYLDCENGQVCIEGKCVEDNGGQFDNNQKPDNNTVVDNEQPDNTVPDNNSDNGTDDKEQEDEDVGGGGQCTKDTDCDDEDPCTDNKCDTGYCFYPLKEEICNGIDDNCNDKIDETFEGMDEECATGLEAECAVGIMTCVEGVETCLSPFHLQPELCNGMDDNCDGEIDVFTPEEAPDCPLNKGLCANAKKTCNGTDWEECTVENYGENYSEVDVLDEDFLDSNCDGVDGLIENHIYVDIINGDDDLNDGSYSSPVKTIAKGIELAGIDGKTDVLIAKGVYPETVNLATGISLHGGFSGFPDWNGADENETIIAGGQIGVLAEEVENVNLNHLTITSADRNEGEGSSYAVFLFKMKSLIINNCLIIGGHGADGADGNDGDTGANGTNGGSGDKGCEDSGGLCSSCSRPDGGAGGKNTSCGMNGGNGGQPGRDDSSGSPGGVGANGGGAAGRGGVSHSSGDVCNASSSSAVYSIGGDGSSGGNGTDAPVVVLADFTQAGFSPNAPNDGSTGVHGKGGGGGGGGHGGSTNCDSYGSAGGGGGAGGCGGGGGKGGQSGGGSFGIYSFESTDITIANSTIATSGGGKGGNGGAGGTGGTPGTGGAGGPHGGGNEQEEGGCGGWGGDGGSGGIGGHGAGGAGGPSYGIYSINGSLYDENLTYQVEAGGKGGTSSGNPGPDGPSRDVEM